MEHRFPYAIAITVAFLSACGGMQPVGMLDSMTQSGSHATSGAHVRSWMLPEAKSQDLLYVAASCSSGCNVYVFSYPGGKPMGMLTNFLSPGDPCADNHGHVWITDTGTGNIWEFPHGGTQAIARLTDPYGPQACAVDGATGNLAVANRSYSALSIYAHARGKAKVYSGYADDSYTCAYDNAGDIIMASHVGVYAVGLTWLDNGTSEIREFRTHPHIYPVIGDQWYGGYITAVSRHEQVARYTLINGGGKLVGTTQLNGSFPNRYWIQGQFVAGTYQNEVLLWKYPAGGNVVRTISGVPYAQGLTVSLAPD